MADSRAFSVFSRARPFRLAYLVDPAVCPPELLDAVFDRNYRIWGGRLHPIIPVSDGRVWDGFWSLLRYADPDVVYTYADLADETIDRIDRFIGPQLVERHRRYAPGEEPDYRPMVEEMVSSAAVAPLLFRRGFSYDADVLTWHQGGDWGEARWGLRNFGVWAHGVDFGSMPSDFRTLTAESNWTDIRLLTELGRPYRLILPLQASASHTRFFTPRETEHEKVYTLVVGDDALTWMYFWNRVLWLSAHERSRWHTLCVSAERLRGDEFRAALREFMARRVIRSGNSSPYLTITSLTACPDELKSLVGPLFQKLDLIPVYTQTDGTRAPYVSHFRARFPEFESETFGWDVREFAHETVSGDRAFLRTPPTPFSFARGAWMMDARIEHRPAVPFASNEQLWWVLPPRARPTRHVLSQRSGRFDSNGCLSIQMGVQAPVDFRIPSESNIITDLMMAGRDVHYTIDLRERKEPVFQEVVPSDKGRYVRAVIDLFGGLYSASHFFENAFWREVVEFLCRRGSAEADALDRVRAKLQKRRYAIRDQIQQGRVDLLAKYVMDVARVEQVREHDVTFQWLHDQCVARITALNEKLRADPKQQETEIPVDETIKDLRRRVQGLTELGVFRQGVGMTCQTCGSRQWRDVDSLRRKMTCEGCGGDLPMPAERAWSYRLNTLVRNAVGLHGALPVISVLGQLRRDAYGSFIGEPGVVLYTRWGDEVAAAEVDIVCVRGGNLWIGEVKTNSAEFAADDLDRLALVALKVSADTAFIAAFDDRSNALQRQAEALRDRLKANGAECGVDTIAPPDYVFEWSGTLF